MEDSCSFRTPLPTPHLASEGSCKRNDVHPSSTPGRERTASSARHDLCRLRSSGSFWVAGNGWMPPGEGRRSFSSKVVPSPSHETRDSSLAWVGLSMWLPLHNVRLLPRRMERAFSRARSIPFHLGLDVFQRDMTR
eukprot:scaffold121_cov356-Pavlova_lutheri.AAC.16